MRFDVVTIFPEMFPGPLGHGVIGRALERRLFEVQAHDLRAWAAGPHRQVDDEPFGGGAGMVLKPEPLFAAVRAVRAAVGEQSITPGPVILLSPQGRRLEQARVKKLVGRTQVTLICGRYEGVDERVREHLVDEEISIGDYVLTGGELAAMVLIEAIVRWLPEALGDPASARHDSFVQALLDHPQYTRPASFEGRCVPEVLRSGDHRKIRAWRRREALRNTARKRPDLLAGADLSAEERQFVESVRAEMERARAKDGSALE